MSGTRKAAPSYLWDIDTGHVTEMPLVAASNGGHDAYGYGTRVNQFCCTSSTTYDGVPWQYRSLDNPYVTRDVIPVVMTPKLVYVADHPVVAQRTAGRARAVYLRALPQQSRFGAVAGVGRGDRRGPARSSRGFTWGGLAFRAPPLGRQERHRSDPSHVLVPPAAQHFR